MEAFEFRGRAIKPGTWLIEGDGCTCYALAGDDNAMMIDTGYGVHNIRAFAETLIRRRIPWAANTHGHFDHAGGNGFFERAYLSAEADKIARIPYPSFKGQTFNFDYESVIVGDGFTLDLGRRPVDVIAIPAHDPSSLAFLDRRERVLFVGDEAGPHVPLIWQRADAQPTVEQYARNMEKLLAHRAEFDAICTGHGEGLLDGAYIEKDLACAEKILAGMDGEPLPPQRNLTWEEWKRAAVPALWKGAVAGGLFWGA